MDVSFSLNRGEVMGLVGESGSGKSVTAKSLMNLNAMNAVYSPESSITLHSAQEEIDVLSLKKPADLKVVRGGAISNDLSRANGKLCAINHHWKAND